MIDVAALVINYLRLEQQPAFAELPADVGRPCIRVEEAGGPPDASSLMPNRLTRQDLQLTVWGSSKAEAFDQLDIVLTLLHLAPRLDPVQDAGVIVKFEPIAGAFYSPDRDWPIEGRPGPRYEQTIRVTAHG